MQLILPVFVSLLLLFTPDNCTAQTVRGMVKTVYDGDTVVLVGRDTGRIKVRLYGIDAPETRKPDRPGQPYGAQAERVLKFKLLGKEVLAELQDKDQYGRAVAIIRLGNRDINSEMVSEGMAWAYRQYLKGAYVSRYIDLEERARRQRVGLWRDRNPTPPWEFRQTLIKKERRR